jgi:hypothetical protein
LLADFSRIDKAVFHTMKIADLSRCMLPILSIDGIDDLSMQIRVDFSG